MAYLITEISAFLLGAFVLGWWVGRHEGRKKPVEEGV